MKLWFQRHQHAWRDVERTIEERLTMAETGHPWVQPIQYILQWCESCGQYRQIKIKGASQSGPAPLRSPVPDIFLREE